MKDTSTMMMMYVTCPDKFAALQIGRTIVNERLAACANIIEPMTSIYLWQGDIREDSEVVLIVKTTSELLAKCGERIRALHSYDVPCILSWAFESLNSDYTKWLKDSVQI